MGGRWSLAKAPHRVPLGLFVATAAVPAVAAHMTTVRVSLSSTGTEGNGASLHPATPGTGRFVAFSSSASNLVPGDTNGTQDAFVHDRATGTTTRVSVSSSGAQADDVSALPALSPEGRLVAFASSASNLVPEDANGTTDVFVHDLDTRVTSLVSVSLSGQAGNGASNWPSVSATGRFIAFGSFASDLVPGDTNGATDVFVRDMVVGSTTRLSLSSSGRQGDSASFDPSISASGQVVAFASHASNLGRGDTNTCLVFTDPGECPDVYVHDRERGLTFRASVSASEAQANDLSLEPSISGDGRFVAVRVGSDEPRCSRRQRVPRRIRPGAVASVTP